MKTLQASKICTQTLYVNCVCIIKRVLDPTFFFLDPDPTPNLTLIRNEEKNIFIF